MEARDSFQQAESQEEEAAQSAAPLSRRHNIAPRDTWAWLPTQDRGFLMPHPWCADCGEVAALGTSRGLDFGGLVNLLGRLARRLKEHGHRLTEAQQRLIVRDIKKSDLDDRFGLSRDAQLKILSEIAGKHLRMPTDIVESYVRSC